MAKCITLLDRGTIKTEPFNQPTFNIIYAVRRYAGTFAIRLFVKFQLGKWKSSHAFCLLVILTGIFQSCNTEIFFRTHSYGISHLVFHFPHVSEFPKIRRNYHENIFYVKALPLRSYLTCKSTSFVFCFFFRISTHAAYLTITWCRKI